MEQVSGVIGYGIYCHHTSRFQHNTGIQRCVRSIARALNEAGECISPLVWDPSTQGLRLAGPDDCNHLARWSGPPAQAWTTELLSPGSCLLVAELLSGPHHPHAVLLRQLCSRRQWKLAAVFHDAIPLSWGGAAAKHHAAYMQGLAEFDLVLATSNVVANALRRFWHSRNIIPRGQLVVLSLPAEIPGLGRCWPANQRVVDQPLKLLQVGSLEPRKNHKAVLCALAWLESWMPGAVELDLVGWANNPSVVDMVKRAVALGLPVRWHQHVDDSVLQKLYSEADFTVYPSLLEGFGLPVLESLWLGTPCLCTWVPALEALPESKGCELLRDPSWNELASSLQRMLLKPLILSQHQKELRQLNLKSWAEYVDQMCSLAERQDSDSRIG